MSENATVTLPFIHTNGTSAGDLLDGYRNAMDKVAEAVEALSKIEFNARDYYPVPGSWEKARAEMVARRVALERVREELEQVAIHCSDHIAEKEARAAERAVR